MRKKKTKKNNQQLSSKGRRKANKELKEALKKFNSRDHSGKSFRQIIGEVGEIVGQVARQKLERAEKKWPVADETTTSF